MRFQSFAHVVVIAFTMRAWFAKHWRLFLARHRLSMAAVCEMSAGRGPREDFHDDGFAVNADVNGSLNVGRKVIPEFFGIGDRSLAARPVRINPLKAFCVQRQKAG